MENKIEIKWLVEPEDKDYPAAGTYLSLLYDEPAAAKYVEQLRKAPMSKFKAKDIFERQATKRSPLPMAIIECARPTHLTRMHRFPARSSEKERAFRSHPQPHNAKRIGDGSFASNAGRSRDRYL